MKRLLILAIVATTFTASGCGYLNAWRCNRGWGAYEDPYTVYDGVVMDDCMIGDHGAIMDDGQYPVYMPGDGAIYGPEIIVPGETVPAPAGEPLPEPAA